METENSNHPSSDANGPTEPVVTRTRDVPSRIRYVVALGATIVIALLGFYLAHFRTHHDLEATLFGFYYDPKNEQLSIDIMFTNGGNQHEAVIAANFILPFTRKTTSELWPGVDRVILSPIVLKPGEIVYRKLAQPMPLNFFAERENRQIIGVKMIVRAENGLPLTKAVYVSDLKVEGESGVSYLRHGNVVVPGGRIPPFIKVDLLKGGEFVVNPRF